MNKTINVPEEHQPKFLKKHGSDYTPEERKELEKMYDEVLPISEEYEIIKGKVIRIGSNEVIIDIGLKSDGVVPLSEFRDLPDLKIGDEVELYLEEQENKKGSPVISRKKATLVKAWKTVQEALETREVLQGLVKRRTKGGLIVDIHGIEAFLPGSQIDVKPVLDFDDFVGNMIDVAVIKIKKSNDNVVVSHKVLIEKEIESQKITIINNLEKGQILEGTVKNITNFGVFIDLGGVDGLLHITDISWSKVSHPETMFERGQKVKVVVTDFDESKQRISLGMKQLTPHPWASLSEDIKEGTVVKGKVVNLTDYGAFLEIQKGVEGLIHVSEMSWSQYINSPKDYAKIGDELEAVVLSIDRNAKRMSLGIKQLTPMPWSKEIAGSKYPVGTSHKGIVRNITNFGAFVELEPGLEGLLHVSDLSWTKKVNHPSEILKVGDEIEVQVLTLDIENRKLTLGIKQLEEDPWNAFEEVFNEGTIHKGTVLKKMPRGAVIELPYGIEGYVPQRGLLKEDKTELAVGEILDFVVLEFLKDERRIILSHTDTFSKTKQFDTKKESSNKRSATPKRIVTASKSTLGDIQELSMLKEKLKSKNKLDSKKTKEEDAKKEDVKKSKGEKDSKKVEEEKKSKSEEDSKKVEEEKKSKSEEDSKKVKDVNKSESEKDNKKSEEIDNKEKKEEESKTKKEKETKPKNVKTKTKEAKEEQKK